MERIVDQLNEFFEKSKQIILNCAQIPFNERDERVAKLRKQLNEQEMNIKFLDTNHPDKQQVKVVFKKKKILNFLDPIHFI